MTKNFRYLILTSFGLYALWFHFPYVEPLLFDQDQIDVWDSSGFDAKIFFPQWHYYLWFAYWIVVWYGLFHFFRWSRDAMIIGYILSYFTAPIYGTVIQSPISNVLGNLHTLLDGIIIGIAYFSPISARFKRGTGDDSQNQIS